MPQWDVETEVLVVGAGACGFAAATAAADAGVEAVIVEKADRLGQCNTALTAGSVAGAGTRFQRAEGIEDSPDLMYEDVMRQSGPHEAMELTRLLANESASLVEWLVDDLDIELRLITYYKHVGHSVPRLHGPPSHSGQDLLDGLTAAARRRGIAIALASPVTELVTEGPSVIGAVVAGGRARQNRIHAKKVILATNGFGANPELVRTYCADIAGAPYFGAQGNTGEAVIWGNKLGARLANMAAYQGYATLVYPQGSLLSWTLMEIGGILVTAEGRRFGDESAGYSGFAKDVRAQGQYAYAVFDKKILDYVAHHEEDSRELLTSASLKRGSSLADVARQSGIDPARLAATVDAYTDAARGQRQDAFGRRNFGMAPLEPPFFLVKVQAGLFHTQGGLWVDEQARPRLVDGGIIRNLFAGGGAAAGIAGSRGGAGYSSGTGMLCALGLGRIAGRAAAREIAADRGQA